MVKPTGDTAHLRIYVYIYRSNHWRCSIKSVFLRISQNSQEKICIGVSLFNQVAGLFSYELREISNNTHFVERLLLDFARLRTCL